MNETIHTRATTIGGTMTIILANIHSEDIVKTMVLGAIGATVSYVMSLVIKKVVSWWKARKG